MKNTHPQEGFFRVLKDRPDGPESRPVYRAYVCSEIKYTSPAHCQNGMLPNLGLQLAFLLELSMAQMAVGCGSRYCPITQTHQEYNLAHHLSP